MPTRTLTDTARIAWAETPAGVLSADVVDGSITPAKLAETYLTAAAADALFLTPAEGNALYLTPAAGDALFLTPAEGNAAYQPLDADLTTLGAGGSGARDFLDLGTTDSPQFTNLLVNSVTSGTADSGNVLEEYALSDEGDYSGILHTLSDDYNRITQIMRTASTDGQNSPFIIGLCSRGTLDSPTVVQATDRGLSFAFSVRAADATWQRLGYLWMEAKTNPSGNSTPGMFVVRLTKTGQYYPDDETFRMDWTDGARFGMHHGFDGVVDQTDAATITWDVTAAQVAEVTLAGNRTLLPTGMKDGFVYDLFVTADASARTLSFSTSGGREWYLRGSDGIFYDQNSPIALPAAGFAHIKISAGGSGLVYTGTVTLITGHPQRAVVPSKQLTSLTSSRSGTNVNTAQPVFASTEDALTVAASTTYRFDAVISFSTAATNAHTISTLFGGTATFTGIGYLVQGSSNETGLGGTTQAFTIAKHINVATATDIFGSVLENPLLTTLRLSGIMRINAAGTIIPQVQFSAAPGAAPSFLAGSYFECWPIGNNNVVAVGDWA